MAAALALAATAGQGAALAQVRPAAQRWNAISGTAFSGGSWYLSSVLRHHTNSGSFYIKLAENTNPYLEFRLVNTAGHVFGSTVNIKSTNVQYTLASNVGPLDFYNEFEIHAGDTCFGSGCNFSGSEYY
jgi:hypothetical protein